MSYDAPKNTHIGYDQYGYLSTGSVYLPTGFNKASGGSPRRTKKEEPKLSGGKYQHETLTLLQRKCAMADADAIQEYEFRGGAHLNYAYFKKEL